MGYNYNLQSISRSGQKLSNSEILVPARVVDVILDSTHPEFEKYGRWGSIGLIKYRVLTKQQNTQQTTTLPIAYPLQAHIKHLPLKNEIVLIASFPSENLGESATNDKNYYIDIVNLWNHPHHNAHPGKSENPDLGDDFEELADVNPMRPFEGDVIVEGRQGQSLRFSTSVKGKTPWEGVKKGAPIIVLSNGQIPTDNGFEYITEDINSDFSSIYLTADQKLNLNPSQTFSIFKPTKSSEYNLNQVALTSGRIVLNSKDEHILLTSKLDTGIKGANIYFESTQNTVLEGTRINLGTGASEPAILGQTMLSRLASVITQLNALAIGLSSIGIPQVTAPASEVIRTATEFLTAVPTMKSTKVYIKR